VTDSSIDVDIAVIGASLGGVLAAWRACVAGRRVALTAAHDWIGGQMTAQAVPPDEHALIEHGGASASYLAFRTRMRERYTANPDFIGISTMTPGVCNPGDGWVSRLCIEPPYAVAYFESLLAPFIADGRLQLLRGTTPVAVTRVARSISAITVQTAQHEHITLRAAFFLDGTDTGDVIALAQHRFRVGKESQSEFGECDAPDASAPDDQQPVTAVLALRYEDKPVRINLTPPPRYAHWCAHVVPHYGHALFSEFGPGSSKGERMRLPLFADDTRTLDWWRYRRIVSRAQWRQPVREVSLINWAQNDFADHPLIDDARINEHVISGARELSQSFFHWLRHEAPRHGTGVGYPELSLAVDMVGAGDGLAQQIYVRESRRITSMDTLSQMDIVSIDGDLSPFHAAQSVGTAWYNMDIHPTVVSGIGVNARVRPFTLRFGCFVSDECDNLIPACKNIGVTHLVNACTRVHPIEWMIGEIAALTAVECMSSQLTPQQMRADTNAFHALQNRLIAAGIPLSWDAELLTHLTDTGHGISHT
jgi:hypothetical protein